MSEADNYPDYDFSFLDGTVGSDLAVVGKGLDAAAADVQSHTRELSDTADGATVTQVHEDLVEIRDALSAAATNAAQTAEAFEVMKAAWAAWQAIAPRQAEIVAAEAAVARAREMLKASDNHHAGLARGALKRAQDTLRDLIQRREDADAALVEALEKARNMLALAATVDVSGERVGRRTPSPTTPAPDVPKSTEPGAPSTPSAAAPSPAAAAPAPSAELPAPGTSLSAAGDASTPALSPTAAAALGAADRLGNDPVDHAQLLEVLRGEPQRFGRFAHLLGVLPQDRGASLGRDH